MRNEMLIIGAGSISSTLATRLLEDSNRGNNVVARGRWPLCIAVLPGQLVCLGLMLAVPAVWSTVMAAEKHEFVVRPDQAPHFSGPAGMERLITEVFAIREQTGGTFGIWRYEIKPEGGPPSHSHREEDEFFYVMGGEFHFQLGVRILSAPTGSFVFIPRGAVHTYQNTGSKPGVLLGGVTPAGFEGYFMEGKNADEEANKALMKNHPMEVVGPPLESASTRK
jgi:quercetin dioxygenase-like cupin family protein